MKIEDIEKANELIGRVKILRMMKDYFIRSNKENTFNLELKLFRNTITQPYLQINNWGIKTDESDIEFVLDAINKRIMQIEREIAEL